MKESNKLQSKKKRRFLLWGNEWTIKNCDVYKFFFFFCFFSFGFFRERRIWKGSFVSYWLINKLL